MFDAKSILDALMRGGAPAQGRPSDAGSIGGLEDLLRQLPGGQSSQPADEPARAPRGRAAPDEDDDAPPSRARTRRARPADEEEEDAPADPRAASAPQGSGGLEDVLRNILGGQGGNIGDILGKLQQQAGQPGGIGDILGQVFGQATSGAREGAERIDEATGASRRAREAATQLTGRAPEDLISQIKELLAQNQLGTGAALGGLGALLLGTKTGRSLATNAAKIGGLALIGGLAYKAYQNYQQGQPASTDRRAQPAQLLAAPEGSGFEAGAGDNDRAMLLIRAMIAAAAADGRIDEKEQEKILGGLKQGGLDSAAQQFLAREFDSPATVEDLAGAVASQEEGVQVYTAARIAIDPDAEDEHEFLEALAEALGIDEQLAAHIDATARGAGA